MTKQWDYEGRCYDCGRRACQCLYLPAETTAQSAPPTQDLRYSVLPIQDLRYSVLRRQLSKLSNDQLRALNDTYWQDMVYDECNYDPATALGVSPFSDEDCYQKIQAAGFSPRNMRGVPGAFFRGGDADRAADLFRVIRDVLESRLPRPMSKIYAAGPSASPEEADMFCRMLAEAGWDVTSTWPGSVTVNGGGNPPQSTEDQRFQWSESDRLQVEAADVLWARTPPPGVVTHGTFWEMGYARGRGKHVVVSGPDHHRSIFTSQADAIFGTHMEAVAYLSRILSQP